MGACLAAIPTASNSARRSRPALSLVPKRRVPGVPPLNAGHSKPSQPTLGRFLVRDPIGYSGGMNLYANCGNNPLNCTDPSGLDAAQQAAITDAINFIEANSSGLSPNIVPRLRAIQDSGAIYLKANLKIGTYGFRKSVRGYSQGGKIYVNSTSLGLSPPPAVAARTLNALERRQAGSMSEADFHQVMLRVNDTYTSFLVELAALLVHEGTHEAGARYKNEVADEQAAYTAEAVFLNNLKSKYSGLPTTQSTINGGLEAVKQDAVTFGYPIPTVLLPK
ncbi:MAG: RHS repeat-associated core domain-containing protein [Vulcanimicrobiota bacterium]